MLLSSTWGQHSCTYVAGAAAAIAAAAISPQNCRGRCVLQEDGTLDITGVQNSTNATINSFDVTNDLANFTSIPASLIAKLTAVPGPAASQPSRNTSTMGKLGNTTNLLNPSLEGTALFANDSSIPALEDDGAYPSSSDAPKTTADGSIPSSSNEAISLQQINGEPTDSSDTGPDVISYNDTNTPPPDSSIPDETSNSDNGYPNTSNNTNTPFADPPNLNDTNNGTNANYSPPPPPTYAIFNTSSDLSGSDTDPTLPLDCPCNCTYVSASCCLSDNGIVFEDPSYQIPMDPLPANAPVCCNDRTGHWIWKSSGQCSEAVVNGSANGFVGLGSRPWNNTFDDGVGFPSGEDGGSK